MTLVLQGIALNDEPMSQPLIGRFDERGGTLGRSESATFTLPDPQRLISRLQAQILFQDESYWIENVSAATSPLHNGRPLSAGMRVLLREGDEIRIGGYTLVVAFENDEVSASILRGRTSIITPPGSLIAPRASGPHSAPTLAIPIAAPADAQPSGKPAGTPKPAHHEPSWSERTLIMQPAEFLNDLTRVPATPQTQSSSAENASSSEEPGTPSMTAAKVGPGAAAVQAGAHVQPSAKPAGSQKTSSDDPLWRAFLEGAGIELPNSLSPEFMRLVGTLLRTAIEGTHRLVTMRATAKEEIHAEMTRIQTRGNNPLKFAPDATVALQFLLQPPVRGFTAGPTALQETMVDLQSHQVAMTAGMLSAVEAVLDRFDPSKVEALLTTQSVLDTLLPTHRGARLWEFYTEHYRSLREDAQEAFNLLCAEAFRKAYEEAQGRSGDTTTPRDF
jgi:FHA domain-containing protein